MATSQPSLTSYIGIPLVTLLRMAEERGIDTASFMTREDITQALIFGQQRVQPQIQPVTLQRLPTVPVRSPAPSVQPTRPTLQSLTGITQPIRVQPVFSERGFQ